MNTKYTTRMCLLLAIMALGSVSTKLAAVAAAPAADYDGFNKRATASATEHLNFLQKAATDGTLVKVKNYKNTLDLLNKIETRDGVNIYIPFVRMINLTRDQGFLIESFRIANANDGPSRHVDAVLDSIRNIGQSRDITAAELNTLFNTNVTDIGTLQANNAGYKAFLSQISQREARPSAESPMYHLLSSINSIDTYKNISSIVTDIEQAKKQIVNAIKTIPQDVAVTTTSDTPYTFNISKDNMAKIIVDMLTAATTNLLNRADRAMQNVDAILANKQAEVRQIQLLGGFLNRVGLDHNQIAEIREAFFNNQNGTTPAQILVGAVQAINQRRDDNAEIYSVLQALEITPGLGEGVANQNDLANDDVFTTNGSANLTTLTFSELLAQQSDDQIERQRIKESIKRGTSISRSNDVIRSLVFGKFNNMQLRSVNEIKRLLSPMLSEIADVEMPGYKAALDQAEDAVNNATKQLLANGSTIYTVAQRQLSQAEYDNLKKYLESSDYKDAKNKLSGTTPTPQPAPVLPSDAATLTTAQVATNFLSTANAADDAEDLATKLFENLQTNGKYKISEIKDASQAQDLLNSKDIVVPNMSSEKLTAIVNAVNEEIKTYNKQRESLKAFKRAVSSVDKTTNKKKLSAAYIAAVKDGLSLEAISVLAQNNPAIAEYLVAEAKNEKIKKQVMNALKIKKTPGTKTPGKKTTGTKTTRKTLAGKRGLTYGTKTTGKKTAGKNPARKNTGNNKPLISYGTKKKAPDNKASANKRSTQG